MIILNTIVYQNLCTGELTIRGNTLKIFVNQFKINIRSVIEIIFLFIIISILSSDLQAQESNLKFERISLEDGLSQATTLCTLQDNKGYIWIGTQDGLNRFDGYTFTIFRHNPEDSTSLSNNYIRSIFQDRKGIIWIGTKGGLNIFDPKTQAFSHFQHDPNNMVSLSNNNVRSIIQDHQNSIWIGTDRGLNLFDPQTQTFSHFQHDPNNPSSLSNNLINSIFQDRQNRIWIGRAHV